MATDIDVVCPCCLEQVAAGVKFSQLYIQVSFQRELAGSLKDSWGAANLHTCMWMVGDRYKGQIDKQSWFRE